MVVLEGEKVRNRRVYQVTHSRWGGGGGNGNGTVAVAGAARAPRRSWTLETDLKDSSHVCNACEGQSSSILYIRSLSRHDASGTMSIPLTLICLSC